MTMLEHALVAAVIFAAGWLTGKRLWPAAWRWISAKWAARPF